jgi:hypothetical protein
LPKKFDGHMASLHSFPRAASFAAILHLFEKYEASWIRKRVWGPMHTLLTLFAMVEPGRASSYQSAGKTAWTWAQSRFGWKEEPDGTGFMRARARVTEEECACLLESARALSHSTLRGTKRLICALLPVGIDGAILHMPRSKALVDEYGIPKNKLGLETCHYPQALLVSAWDLVRRIPLAWSLTSCTTGEREAMRGLLPQLPGNALLIRDRGYPSDVVFGAILDSGRHFVARMVASQGAAWAEVNAFLASGERDAVVPVEVGHGSTRRMVMRRMVLRTFDRGRPHKHQTRDTMVVITSVLDESLSARELCRLYGARWGIETIYREMKAAAKIEQWHGRIVDFVRQEILMLLIWFCFAAIFCVDAMRSKPPRAVHEKDWRANTRRVFEAIAMVMDALLAMNRKPPEVVAEITKRADSALRAMCRWMLRVRLGRSFPRVPLHPYARTIA